MSKALPKGGSACEFLQVSNNRLVPVPPKEGGEQVNDEPSGKGAFGTSEVIAKVCDATFGKPLVTNVLRGHVVEAIIALALEPEWTWCSADYASWDFERADGLRLEVKQSSYRQSWETAPGAKISPGFDVAARKAQSEGGKLVSRAGRAAHLYILAYHDVRDNSADHRDPSQWTFFVIATSDLPPVARIALGSVRRIAEGVDIRQLAERVAAVAKQCRI